jgi:hypothetical protein
MSTPTAEKLIESRFEWLTAHAREIGQAAVNEARTLPDPQSVGEVVVHEVEKMLSEHVCREGHDYRQADVPTGPQRIYLYCRRCGTTKLVILDADG